MDTFDEFRLIKQLRNALADLGFVKPTPIQAQSYNVIRSGKNVVGIAQTGTGKTLAYTLPVINELKYSTQKDPRVLILVPTRELVVQVVEMTEQLTEYISLDVKGVYGGTNINTQKQMLLEGCDILVATPGRLYDLALSYSIKLKYIKQLIIDEVDVMLDLGFRFQLTNLFDLLPVKRQNIMFSATMTTEVDELINDFFIAPQKIQVAVSGTPLDNIEQSCYHVLNFYTKVNLLRDILQQKDEDAKVLIFASSKRRADLMFRLLEEDFGSNLGIIHSNKSQNHRLNTVDSFEKGELKFIITTDVMARGLDIFEISHVINFNAPEFPENYMHRIGRTGRAEKEGQAILFYTEKETAYKTAIEELMNYKIPELEFPEDVEVNRQLLPSEKENQFRQKNPNRNMRTDVTGAAFHEKKLKNQKTNLGSKYHREKKHQRKKNRKKKR